MTGRGQSHGSVTIINAMPCGIGATMGVDLSTSAQFSISGDTKEVVIRNDPGEDDSMARICVRKAFEAIGADEPEGWSLRIESEIPVSRGLKSSSAACNAILRAVFDEMSHSMEPINLIRLGVGCAREAGVTVTGSFDDACGCGIGGLVMTDNRCDTVLAAKDVPEYDVMVHVPEFKIRKTGLPLDRLKAAAPDIERIIRYAMDDPFRAMTENGRIISAASGLDNNIAEMALDAGALGAGISGSGPAVAIILPPGEGAGFVKEMDVEYGDMILTRTRCGE